MVPARVHRSATPAYIRHKSHLLQDLVELVLPMAKVVDTYSAGNGIG